MKLNKNYLQTLIFIAVYLFAIYFWTQPFHEKHIPYGEYDAMSHFEIGDYMAFNDKSFMELPHYIDLRYGTDNKFRNHILWYPPPYHTSFGITEVLGGERMVPVFLMNAVMSTFVIITTYFVISSLFGFLPAILSSFLLIFSPRDFMPYLWGQWPERFGYAFIPIVLYCFYKYLIGYSTEEKNPKYLYLSSLFLGMQLLVHPLSFFHSLITAGVLYLFMVIKQKRFIFNVKHILIGTLMLIILMGMFPYQTLNVFANFWGGESSDAKGKSFDLGRLFHWSLNADEYAGSVPASYFSYKEMHGLWTLPFLLIGLVFLAIRRQEKDLFLLAWLVGLYIAMHRDIIGVTTFLHRSLSATAHIFVPITAVGLVYAASAVKLPGNYNKYLRYGLAAVFVYFTLTVNMESASDIMKKDVYLSDANDFLTRLSPHQFDAAEWVLYNVPEEKNLSVLGIPHGPNFVSATAKNIRWFAAVSQHPSRFYFLFDNESVQEYHIKNDYILLDYTMLGPVGDQDTFNTMQQMETEIFSINYTLLYNQNNIRVYKLAE